MDKDTEPLSQSEESGKSSADAEAITDRILSDLDHLAQLMMTGYGASPER